MNFDKTIGSALRLAALVSFLPGGCDSGCQCLPKAASVDAAVTAPQGAHSGRPVLQRPRLPKDLRRKRYLDLRQGDKFNDPKGDRSMMPGRPPLPPGVKPPTTLEPAGEPPPSPAGTGKTRAPMPQFVPPAAAPPPASQPGQ